MTITRSRIAALGAAGLLIIGGASVAFAQNPAVPATPEAVEDPATGPDLDNIQEGDQTGVDEAGGSEAEDGQTGVDEAGGSEAEDGAEDAAGAPDTDNIEEGDQESDGPGGHEDADKNADHQFEGEE